MPPVPVPRRPEQPPATPEKLYDRLTVTDERIGALWRHQSHVLGRYYEVHRNSPDVALELPTGAGKTLVGLLIADWRRRDTGRASAFLCPTNQLAQQAHDKAVGYGIPTVLLTGSNLSWDPADKTRGTSAGATIVSTYSHVFNIKPKLNPATLVLDDAHAAESFVAGNWSLSIARSHLAYEPLRECLADVIDRQRLIDLTNDNLGPNDRPAPVLVGPADLRQLAAPLLAILDAHVTSGESASYAVSQIRAHFGGCVLYLAWNEILVRPFIPPTRFHPAFQDAQQRVYLSATLGSAGEIERSFGRTTIPRVATPADWERHGSGRRLVLLPSAGMKRGQATAFIKDTMKSFPRALVLVPSTRRIDDVCQQLPEDWTVLTTNDVDDRLRPFITSDHSALVLANRYDGIDLPGETCKLILISGLPTGTHLQERFLFETADAKTALRERMRTRLMQGMGRATRSRTERALVIFAGEDLVWFVSDPTNLVGMRPELNAEIEYGRFLSSREEPLSDTVKSFFANDENWGHAETYLRELAENADLSPPAGAAALERSAPEEVLACEAAWRGDTAQAAAHAQAAVRQLTVKEVGGYRTLWKVLAAHWAALRATASGDPLDARLAAELARDAQVSARTRPWHPRLPEITVPGDARALDRRAIVLTERLLPLLQSPKVDKYIGELETSIVEDEHGAFERGLLRLGEMLGFEAVRPGTNAAPDGAWRDGQDQILWEAKSEQFQNGNVSAKLVRQASSHATWVDRELDWHTPDSVVTLLVTPRTTVDADAVSVVAEHVRLCDVAAVRTLAVDTVELWRAILGRVAGLKSKDVAELIARELRDRGLTTAELPDRLNARKIATMDVTPPDPRTTAASDGH